jgi:hypothetical protein
LVAQEGREGALRLVSIEAFCVGGGGGLLQCVIYLSSRASSQRKKSRFVDCFRIAAPFTEYLRISSFFYGELGVILFKSLFGRRHEGHKSKIFRLFKLFF